MLLIRHASAGDRSRWTGDDRHRPLDDQGRRQARALVELLSAVPVERILSSPYDRCVQTVAPLAAERGLPIELREELGEELQEREGAALVRALLAEDVAVSCHGGLSELIVAEGLRKGEAFVIGPDATLQARFRA